MAVTTGLKSDTRHQQVEIGLLDVDSGTGTCSSNAVTISRGAGVITTESLTTAAGATQAITLTNTEIAAGDMVLAMCDPGSSTGTPTVVNTAVSANTAVFLLQNVHSSASFNAAVKIYFLVVKARVAGNFVNPV